MGFLEVRSYGNKKGSSTVFIQSPAESKNRVSETLMQLSKHRRVSEETKTILFDQVENAILRTQGPLPIARL